MDVFNKWRAKMKAWGAVNELTGYATTVFAETRGKAKSAMLNSPIFEGDWDYTEIRVYREPQLDDEYRGHVEMDWCDDKDRLALVKLTGIYCHDDCFDLDECERCVAKAYCDRYEECIDEDFCSYGERKDDE